MKLTPRGEAFRKKYLEQFKEEPIYGALNAYAQVVLLADAINAAKSDKPDDLVKALLAGKFEGLERHDQLHARRGPVLAAVDAADAVHAVHQAGDAVRRRQDRLPARAQDRGLDAGAQALSRRPAAMDADCSCPSTCCPGLVIGVIYSLMALGITFIYSIMKMINWSMGEFYMIGSYVQYALIVTLLGRDRWYLALPLAMASVFLLGLVVQRFLLRPMYVGGIERRDEYATIITIALMVFFRNLAIVLGGPNQYAPPDYARPVTLGTLPDLGQPVRGARSARSCCSALFYLVIKTTWVGRALRGAAQNRVGIQTAGIDVLRLDMLAFGVGVALAAAAGALLAPDFLVYPENGAISTFKGFEIIVIGGLGSILGSMVGGRAAGRDRGAGLGLHLRRLQGPLRLPAPDRPAGLPADRAVRRARADASESACRIGTSAPYSVSSWRGARSNPRAGLPPGQTLRYAPGRALPARPGRPAPPRSRAARRAPCGTRPSPQKLSERSSMKTAPRTGRGRSEARQR